MTLYPPLSSLIPTHMTITPGFQWANFDLFAPEARDKGETTTRGWGVGEGEEFACAQSSVGAVALGLFRRLGLCVGIIASISLIRVSGV